MVHFGKCEMNNITLDTVWEAFDRVDVAGRSKAVCRLCQHQLVANRSTMYMHYRMKHCKSVNNAAKTDNALASKPLSVRTKTPAPPKLGREVCTTKCSQLWQRYLDNVNTKNHDGDGEPSLSLTNSADDADNDRLRDRTIHMLHYLASGPSDEAYASIIANANDQIIKTIAEIGRAYMRGDLDDLSQAESLVLSRFKDSIDKFAYYRTAELGRYELLKPRPKQQRPIPESAEYVPMLLALALDRGGVETYADNANASTDADSSDASDSNNSGDSDGSSDGRHSDDSSGVDSEGSSDGRHGNDSSGDSDGSSNANPDSNASDSETSSDDANCSASDSEVAQDEQGDSMTPDEEEEDEEEEEESSEEDEETGESEEESSEPEESEEDAEEDSEEAESEETGEEEESDGTEESEDDQHSAKKNLKRHRGGQSYIKSWKRGRFYF
jgi:hypothetical protein